MTLSSPYQSLIPAARALKALIEEAVEADDGAPLQVYLGAQRQTPEDDFVVVAAPTEGGAGILLTPTSSDQGHSQAWTGEIVCLLSTWSGSRDVDARFSRAQQMLDLIAEAVAQDPTLDDTVAVADLGASAQVSSYNDQNGVAVEIAFTVACEVY